jgi:hypothetical protein
MKPDVNYKANPMFLDVTGMKLNTGANIGKPNEQRAVVRLITTPFSGAKQPNMITCEHNILNMELLMKIVLSK